MDSSVQPARNRLVGAGVFVIALIALLFFTRLGARALWSSEGRWAEIAREMRLTGNYFWPTINGKLYYDKPLLSYWLVLGSSYLTGSVDEAASRLPCAVSAMLSVMLLILLVRRLYGERDYKTSLLAGFVLATSYSFVFFARHASADMETVAGELATVAIYFYGKDQKGVWWRLALWTVMALTSLTKGLLGFALPLLIIGSYSLLESGWPDSVNSLMRQPLSKSTRWLAERLNWFLSWKAIPAVMLAALVYWVPFAISHQRMNSNAGISMVFRENVIRFFHPFDHRGPVYLYVFAIFALMAPWSVFLPAALWRAHTTEPPSSHARNGDRFFLVSFWAIFIFFTLSGSRRSYYLLPILPFASVLIARVFTTETELVPVARRLMTFGFMLLVASSALALVGLAIPPELRPGNLHKLPPTPGPIALLLLSIGAAVFIVLAVRFVRNQSRLKLGLSAAAIAYAGLAYVFVFALPAVEPFRGEKPFAQAARHELANEPGHLALYKIWGPGLVYYLANARPIPQYDDPKSMSLAEQRPLWVIALRRDLASLSPGGTVRSSETTFAWENAKERGSKYALVRFP